MLNFLTCTLNNTLNVVLCATQALRDSEGHPYSPFEYNLHHAADGSVVLLPRNTTQPSTSTNSNENGMSHSSNGPRRDKPKDDAKKE